jgi:hypothetical protein
VWHALQPNGTAACRLGRKELKLSSLSQAHGALCSPTTWCLQDARDTLAPQGCGKVFEVGQTASLPNSLLKQPP